MKTPEEILKQANELARQFYEVRGYYQSEDYRFDLATHPHEREAWMMACIAFLELTDTDLEDVLSEIEETP